MESAISITGANEGGRGLEMLTRPETIGSGRGGVVCLVESAALRMSRFMSNTGDSFFKSPDEILVGSLKRLRPIGLELVPKQA